MILLLEFNTSRQIMNNELIKEDKEFNNFFNNIKDLVINSRNKVYQTVNTETLSLYQNIGKAIIELQQGDQRASYGDALLEKLAEKLTNEFGEGFSSRCFVIIDLRIEKVSHQDIEQMQMYVNYYDREIKQVDENKTIGILLSTNKNETVVKYTLPEDNKTIFSLLFSHMSQIILVNNKNLWYYLVHKARSERSNKQDFVESQRLVKVNKSSL